MPHNNKRIALIIPFYNELKRFDFEALNDLANSSINFLDIYLVDDGSTDELPNLIRPFIIKQKYTNLFLLSTKDNLGKANAIRFGFQAIYSPLENYEFIGFTDADFSSPPSEIIRLARLCLEKNRFVFGARIASIHNSIRTTRFRYIQGQFFTLLVEVILGGKFLDSQCGLKFLKISQEITRVFEEEFINDWLIDLEILCRIQELQIVEIIEEILQEWTHKKDSKTRIFDLPRILISLIKLRTKYGKISDSRVKILKNRVRD